MSLSGRMTRQSTTIVNNSPITKIVEGNLKSSLDVSRGLSGKVKLPFFFPAEHVSKGFGFWVHITQLFLTKIQFSKLKKNMKLLTHTDYPIEINSKTEFILIKLTNYTCCIWHLLDIIKMIS